MGWLWKVGREKLAAEGRAVEGDGLGSRLRKHRVRLKGRLMRREKDLIPVLAGESHKDNDEGGRERVKVLARRRHVIRPRDAFEDLRVQRSRVITIRARVEAAKEFHPEEGVHEDEQQQE